MKKKAYRATEVKKINVGQLVSEHGEERVGRSRYRGGKTSPIHNFEKNAY